MFIIMRHPLNLFISFLVYLFIVQGTAYAQTKYQKPILTDSNSWSLVLLPDPQSYMKFERNQHIFGLMMSWIRENKHPLNMQMVLCTGDLVEQNDLISTAGRHADQNSVQQWTASRKAFGMLDHKVPYILATGNHDYGYVSAEYRSTNYDTYFSPHQNPLNQQALREMGPRLNGASTSVNAVYEFSPAQGKKILVMVLEFGPRDEVVAWAKKIVDLPKYANHDVILLTHVYLNKKSKHIVDQKYKMPDTNYGAALFEKLVQPSKNIRLVFSGHIGTANDFDGHLGFRTDKNAAGKTVYQMTFNAQAMGGGWHGNGGDGWLR